MSLSDRRVFLTGLASFSTLASCGFTPIHGTGSPATALYGKITLPDSKSEMDYRLFGQLQHHFGVATSPEYRLRVNTDVASRDLAISGDRSITRYSLTATADFALEDVAGQIVLRDGVRAFTAYNATASAYATRVARRDAFERLAIALADKIFARISARAGELGA